MCKINNTKQATISSPNNSVSFGMKSNLLTPETNFLLEKVINKFNKKNELFSDVLIKSRKKFGKKQGVVINMPEKINDISSFKTGLRE